LFESLGELANRVIFGALDPIECCVGDHAVVMDAIQLKNLGCSHVWVQPTPGRAPTHATQNELDRTACLLETVGVTPVRLSLGAVTSRHSGEERRRPTSPSASTIASM
jgi:hypothetical protein